MENSLENLQKKELELLHEVTNIIKELGLKYYAIGGTCLGAIRHKGFIPWDDDIDIVLPRDDYDVLKKHLQSKKSDKYSIMSYEVSQHYTPIFFKYFDINTTFVGQNHVKYKDTYTGVFIDIMPLDGAPESNLIKNILLIKRKVYLKLNILRRYQQANGIMDKIIYQIIKRKPLDHYSYKMDMLLKKYTLTNTKTVSFPWRRKERMFLPRDYFGDGVDVPFENTSIHVPEKYDAYLKFEFGDYMKLPPKEQQVSHPAAIFDLNNSYRIYSERVSENG